MSPRVRCRRWPNWQRGRERGGARGQSLSCLLGSPQVCQGGHRPPPRVVLAEEGPDPAGIAAAAEEAQPQCCWDLLAPSLSTAAPKAGEVGRVTPDRDANRGLPGSPKRGTRPELSAFRCDLRAASEMSSAQHDEKDPKPWQSKVTTETRDRAQAAWRRTVLNPAN